MAALGSASLPIATRRSRAPRSIDLFPNPLLFPSAEIPIGRKPPWQIMRVQDVPILHLLHLMDTASAPVRTFPSFRSFQRSCVALFSLSFFLSTTFRLSRHPLS